MNTSAQGAQAEAQAASYLIQKGYRILARNFRAPGGEIDLIAQQRKVLVFVEVKQRADCSFGGPLQAVGSTKQKCVAKAAVAFIKTHQALAYDAIRFDVICILPGKLEHIENAFLPPRTTL